MVRVRLKIVPECVPDRGPQYPIRDADRFRGVSISFRMAYGDARRPDHPQADNESQNQKMQPLRPYLVARDGKNGLPHDTPMTPVPDPPRFEALQPVSRGEAILSPRHTPHQASQVLPFRAPLGDRLLRAERTNAIV